MSQGTIKHIRLDTVTKVTPNTFQVNHWGCFYSKASGKRYPESREFYYRVATVEECVEWEKHKRSVNANQTSLAGGLRESAAKRRLEVE